MTLTGDWEFLTSNLGPLSYLAMMFAFTMGIILMNMVIAVISNKYTEVEAKSEIAFWESRLRYIVEVESMKNFKSIFSGKHDLNDPRFGIRFAPTCLYGLHCLKAVIMTLLGLLTGGYLWPRELKEYIFWGDMHEPKLSGDSKILKAEIDELKEQINKLKEQMKEQMKQILDAVAVKKS
jgi:hypothetical protein